MSEADAHVIVWKSPHSGVEFRVPPLSHRQHRIATVAFRGVLSMPDQHDLKQAEAYDRALVDLACSFVGEDADRRAEIAKLHLDELDSFVATVIVESGLDVGEDGSLDGDYSEGK